MKTFYLLFVILAIVGCKKKLDSSTQKSFAANNKGQNFAVIAGYSATQEDQFNIKTDVYNWNNLFMRGNLGSYTMAYVSPSARGSDIVKTFKDIGSRLTPSSTIVFTFSGRRVGGELKFSDGSMKLQDLLAGLRLSRGQRFYFLTDSPEAVPGGAFMLNGGDNKSNFVNFSEIIEFAAQSKPSKNASGRLATEFAGALDTLQRTKSNKSIKDFFEGISLATSRKGFPRAEYRAPQSVLAENIFETFNKTNKPMTDGTLLASGSGASLSDGSPLQSFLSLLFGNGMSGGMNNNSSNYQNMNNYGSNNGYAPTNNYGPTNNFGPTNNYGPTNNNGFNSSANNSMNNANFGGGQRYTLVEASLSYCGPCRDMALSIARDQSLANCNIKTIIADGDLQSWNNFVNDPTVAQHSVAGDIQTLRSQYGSDQRPFTSFPVVFLLDQSGKIVENAEQGTGGYPRCPN